MLRLGDGEDVGRRWLVNLQFLEVQVRTKPTWDKAVNLSIYLA